jgi:hypothetical protein
MGTFVEAMIVSDEKSICDEMGGWNVMTVRRLVEHSEYYK